MLDLDPRRTFTKRQRVEMFERSLGLCDLCGEKVTGAWIAGHILSHALGGRTVIENGQVECSGGCSAKTHKDDTARSAKARRQGGETGQRARRERNGSRLKSRGFSKTLTRGWDGRVRERK